MKRSIANTYICIDAEGQAFPIIARTGNEAHNIANDLKNDPCVREAFYTTHKTIVFKKGE